MKLTALNDLSIAIIEEAKLFDDCANTYARMFAETSKVEYQAIFKTKSECAQAIRRVHEIMCQNFHYLESNMSIPEIEKLNKIEEDKK